MSPATLIHAVVLGLYVFTVYWTFCVLDVPFVNGKFRDFDVGQLKYLTVWNLLAQTTFAGLCLLDDLRGTRESRGLKDFFHAAVGFPVSMFVGLTFWGLMLVDRELVLPKAIDPYFPWWLNHLMHTMIMITTLLEMVMAPRRYPRRAIGLACLAGFMLLYLAWMNLVYYKSGVWVYPILDVLTWPLKIAFYLALLVFAVVLYFAGEYVDRCVWAGRRSSKPRAKAR